MTWRAVRTMPYSLDSIGNSTLLQRACTRRPAPGLWTLLEAGAYTRSLLSSTSAVMVTPPRVPLSNRLGETHAPNVSHKMCLR